jgi:hypothetical protein
MKERNNMGFAKLKIIVEREGKTRRVMQGKEGINMNKYIYKKKGENPKRKMKTAEQRTSNEKGRKIN